MRFLAAAGALMLLAHITSLHAWQAQASPGKPEAPELRSTYVLGADDQIVIRATEADEISDKPVRIGMDGFIRLPMVGRVRAAGLTVEQFEQELSGRLKHFIRTPEIGVTVTEFHSQPVSVLGSVRTPGVHQLQGRKTLMEMLSLAGGLADDAGPTVKITRRLEWGRIPLPGAADDGTGQFSVADVKLADILRGKNPAQNIVVRPYDLISVPRAEMVYVVGQVQRAGGFVLNERESLSVLQALAMAGGLDRAASAKNARILRGAAGTPGRTEIPVDLTKVLTNKAEDVALRPDDILFVPDSAPKRAAIRAIEAAIQTGTGVVIWRR